MRETLSRYRTNVLSDRRPLFDLNLTERNPDDHGVNTQPPPPPHPPSEQSPGTTWSDVRVWGIKTRNAVLAAGFVVLVLGALADIAHFVDGRDSDRSSEAVFTQPLDTEVSPLQVLETNQTVTPTPAIVPTVPAQTALDPTLNTYTVEPGDLLYDIAQRYGTTTQILAELNALEDPNRIEVGQVLAIPDSATES